MNYCGGIKTFIFLDTETTGLPSLENNTTKLTELCMVAIQASHIRLGVFPRVQNKLSLCFNPYKLISSCAEEITGLTNNLLEYQLSFTSDTVSLINGFLNQNQQPLCFVAHNGNSFDYPILRRHINKTNEMLVEDILCVDSLVMFRELHKEELQKELSQSESDVVDCSAPSDYPDLCYDPSETENVRSQASIIAQQLNENTPRKKQKLRDSLVRSPVVKLNFSTSFKMGDIYKRLTKKCPVNTHQAEGDVIMLITCAATLGDKFVDWANINAKKFCDIPPMVPGKKIGT